MPCAETLRLTVTLTRLTISLTRLTITLRISRRVAGRTILTLWISRCISRNSSCRRSMPERFTCKEHTAYEADEMAQEERETIR